MLADPEDPYAHRNLAAIMGNLGHVVAAEVHFRRAVALAPSDQAALFGLAQSVEALGRADEAEGIYRRVIEMNSETPVAEAARSARSAIASRDFRIGAISEPRHDAVMLCLAALSEFERLPPGELRALVFEIAALGQAGIDLNRPEKKYALKSLPGRTFGGLQLVCMLYVGLQQIDPSVDAGFDLSQEYRRARALYETRSQ